MSKKLIESMKEMPEPECRLGYPRTQLVEIFSPQQIARLNSWLYGQTLGFCQASEYDHDLQEYVSTGCGPHGGVVYKHDVARFLRAGTIID